MAWIEIMPGVYAGVPDKVQAKVEVKAEAETTGDPSSGQTVPLIPFGVAQHAIQTAKPSLRRSGRSPKRPARPANTSTASSRLPATSRAPADNCASAAEMPIQQPAKPTSAARPSVSPTPPASRLMSHPTPGTFGNLLGSKDHPLADTRRTIVTDYPTPTTPDLTSQTDGSTARLSSPKSTRRSPRRAQRRRRQLAHTPRGTHSPRLR